MKSKRVVIVEDDFILLELHKHHVMNLGHQVLGCFTNVRETLAYFEHNTADLVLMDIRLEDSEDGIELMKKINSFLAIPVVYITGNTEDTNLVRALDTHVKGFLGKPVSVDELDAIIDTINEINSAIVYAERIQKALFPHKFEISKIFPDYLYLNTPKNIISGDFCLLQKNVQDGTILGGVGDCVGHGIPAALLSVLCYEVLTDISRKVSDIQQIIFLLNKNIVRNLSRLDHRDNVSGSLDLILFNLNAGTCELRAAGIQMTFFHLNAQSGEITQHRLKGPSIGSSFESPSVIPMVTIKYTPGDYFFFFTDGIIDQFGGVKERKLLRSGLSRLLMSSLTAEGNNRSINLELGIRKWQGALPQTDDMLLLGFGTGDINQLTK